MGNFFVAVNYTRNYFLKGFCIVYLAAFLAFYYQAPGLYGDNGLLPARSILENSKHKTFSAKIHYQPTLLWLAAYLGLSTSAAIDVLSLFGAFLAFTGFVSQKFCIIPIFTTLWSLYFSLYQIGQVFVTNTHDEFLLEAGILAIFIAPFLPSNRRSYKRGKITSLNNISFWLCKWLLFRYLFEAGLSKFINGSPKWWTLTAFPHYFETMPLPNALSWYAATKIPQSFYRLFSVYFNACELLVPFLFFSPFRGARITAFYLIAFLQTLIVATGNFNYENVLIFVLLFSLWDDRLLIKKRRQSKSITRIDIIDFIGSVALWVLVILVTLKLYNINFNDGKVDVQIAITKIQLGKFLENYLQYIFIAILVSLGFTVIISLSHVLFNKNYNRNKLFGIVSIIFQSIVAITLFFSSTVPLASLHPSTNSTLIHPATRIFYNRLHKMRIVNQYSALTPNVYTGAGAWRTEIILEGADSLDGPWKEFNFLYKPGNVNHSLPFVVPYSPRIDWQFHWTAQTSYDKQPWILSLAHRILTNTPEVLNLINYNHSPWNKDGKAPKYVRGELYKYKFTVSQSKSWWTRERLSEYFPAYAKNSPVLEDFLKARNLLPIEKSTDGKNETNPIWKQILDSIRYFVNYLEGTVFFWSVLSAGLAIIAVTTNGSS